MKVECPRCGIEGFLEQRGNSYRIKHYNGYIDFSRKYTIHSLDQEDILRMGINGKNHMPKSHSLDQASRQPHTNPKLDSNQLINITPFSYVFEAYLAPNGASMSAQRNPTSPQTFQETTPTEKDECK